MFNSIMSFFSTAFENMGAVIVNLFKTITTIFYDNGITFYGVLLILGITISLIVFAISWFISLGGIDNEDY